MQKEGLKHVSECTNCRGLGWVRGVTGMRMHCYTCDGIGYLKPCGGSADAATLGRAVYELMNPVVVTKSTAGQVYIENNRGPEGSSYVGD